MPVWFCDLPIYLALLLMFVFCNSISIVGYYVSQKFLSKVDNKDVVNKVVWQTILFFTTIFITFWIATNWSNLEDLKLTTIHEANSIGELYNDLNSLENKDRFKLEDKLLNYLNLVVNTEYPQLTHGNESPETNASFRDLALSIYAYKPHNNIGDELRYNRILGQLTQLSNFREGRLSYIC